MEIFFLTLVKNRKENDLLRLFTKAFYYDLKMHKFYISIQKNFNIIKMQPKKFHCSLFLLTVQNVCRAHSLEHMALCQYLHLGAEKTCPNDVKQSL